MTTDKTFASSVGVVIIHAWLMLIAVMLMVAFGPLWGLTVAVPFLLLMLVTKP